MSFGRKGLSQAGLPAPSVLEPAASRRAAPTRAAFAAPVADEDGGFGLADKRRWLLAAVGLIFVVISCDDYFAGTSLITPIDSDLTFAVTAICAVIGFALGVYRWLTDEGGSSRGVRMTLGLFLGAPLLAGMWGNVTVWRIAEHLAFDFSDAAWTRAEYPITSVSAPSRRSRLFSHHTAKIDPFGAGGTAIPITEQQYDAFWDATGTLCIAVMQRTSADGAIQIRTEGSTGLGRAEPAEIRLCRA